MGINRFKWASALIISITAFGVMYEISGRQSNANSAQQQDQKEEREKKERKFKEDSDNLPVVDYEPSLSDNLNKQSIRQQTLRSIRNMRYNDFPIIVKDESGDSVILDTHSVGEFPGIPTLKSDVVLIGVITDAQSFLSDDKSMVYSEYTAQIKKVLKGIDQPLVRSAKSLTFDRLGGAVRFPSGHVRKFREYSFGTPVKGHEYIFFLTYIDVGKAFSLLTAYELVNGRAIAIDNDLRFLKYRDVPDEVILNAVRESMKGGQHQ